MSTITVFSDAIGFPAQHGFADVTSFEGGILTLTYLSEDKSLNTRYKLFGNYDEAKSILSLDSAIIESTEGRIEIHQINRNITFKLGDAVVSMQSLWASITEQDDLFVLGNTQNILDAGGGDDWVLGGDFSDTINCGDGSDFFDGKLGVDTAVYSAGFSSYSIDSQPERFLISDNAIDRNGIDILSNVERLQFSDTMVGLDVGKGENTGEVYRLYLTVLGRNPESDPVGCGFWIDKLDRNILTAEEMVGNFLNSTEFVTRFGGTTNSNESFVNLMYMNLLGRDGHPDSGFNFWLNVLNNHQASREQVVVGFMESPENISNAAPLIGDTPTYQQWAG